MPTTSKTTAQRGYAGPHQRERARWKSIVDRGDGWCSEPICLEDDRWIEPGTAWHLSHNVERTEYIGPSHWRCNVTEGALRAHDAPQRWWRL